MVWSHRLVVRLVSIKQLFEKKETHKHTHKHTQTHAQTRKPKDCKTGISNAGPVVSYAPPSKVFDSCSEREFSPLWRESCSFLLLVRSTASDLFCASDSPIPYRWMRCSSPPDDAIIRQSRSARLWLRTPRSRNPGTGRSKKERKAREFTLYHKPQRERQ